MAITSQHDLHEPYTEYLKSLIFSLLTAVNSHWEPIKCDATFDPIVGLEFAMQALPSVLVILSATLDGNKGETSENKVCNLV